MGFAKKRGFVAGEPQTIKANMNDGQFQLLGGTAIGKTIKASILKVGVYGSAILFPHEGKEGRAYKWLHIFYRDLETNDICATLYKTYSEGQWRKLEQEIAKYAAAQQEELDYTDFVITMQIHKHKEPNSSWVTKFTFCEDEKGNPTPYMEDGEAIEGAKPQRLDAGEYQKSLKFFEENGFKLFDLRIGSELIKNNYSKELNLKYEGLSTIEKKKAELAALASMSEGILTMEEIKEYLQIQGSEKLTLEA